MKLLYGTTNQAKLESMRRITEDLGFEVIGLGELGRELRATARQLSGSCLISESGNNPLENAQLKAEAYYEAFSMPVFSCDSGLYFDNVEESLQPGTHVRRVGGRELSDGEMIDYYAGLAKKNKDGLIGRYFNAICLVMDKDTRFSCMDETLATEPFRLVSIPHKKRVDGFPLDSLSVDIRSGEYYFDMPDRAVESAMEQGFRDFFLRLEKQGCFGR